jgi:hypothetical protein
MAFNTSGVVNVQSGRIALTGGAGAQGASTPGLFDIQGTAVNAAGTINGAVRNDGTLNPGTSPGIITINGDYNQATAGALKIEIAGPNPNVPEFDQVIVSGAVTLGGTLDVTMLPGFAPAPGTSFRILEKTSSGAISGTFAGLPEGAIVSAGGGTFRISYVGGDGNDVVLTAFRVLTWVGGDTANDLFTDPDNWDLNPQNAVPDPAAPVDGDNLVIPATANSAEILFNTTI